MANYLSADSANFPSKVILDGENTTISYFRYYTTTNECRLKFTGTSTVYKTIFDVLAKYAETKEEGYDMSSVSISSVSWETIYGSTLNDNLPDIQFVISDPNSLDSAGEPSPVLMSYTLEELGFDTSTFSFVQDDLDDNEIPDSEEVPETDDTTPGDITPESGDTTPETDDTTPEVGEVFTLTDSQKSDIRKICSNTGILGLYKRILKMCDSGKLTSIDDIKAKLYLYSTTRSQYNRITALV